MENLGFRRGHQSTERGGSQDYLCSEQKYTKEAKCLDSTIN